MRRCTGAAVATTACGISTATGFGSRGCGVPSRCDRPGCGGTAVVSPGTTSSGSPCPRPAPSASLPSPLGPCGREKGRPVLLGHGDAVAPCEGRRRPARSSPRPQPASPPTRHADRVGAGRGAHAAPPSAGLIRSLPGPLSGVRARASLPVGPGRIRDVVTPRIQHGGIGEKGPVVGGMNTC
jgi:hypothetical protein